MWNKFLAIFLSFNLAVSTTAFAEDPQFTNLEIGDPAPFAGTLFNPAAVSELIVDSQFSMDECDLRIQFEKDRTAAEYQLQLDILQASYDGLQERHNLLMSIKQEEIDTYRGMALERPNKNNHW